MRTLALVGCLAVAAIAQEPANKPTDLERLRLEVARKKRELEELREMARLRQEVEVLKHDIAPLEWARLSVADVLRLKKREIPRLKLELSNLVEADRIKRQAAALKRKLEWERLSPEGKRTVRAKRDAARKKMRTVPIYSPPVLPATVSLWLPIMRG